MQAKILNRFMSAYILYGDIMNIKKWHIAGLVFIITVGIFLHFAYDLSGQNMIVGYFSAVNESVWEHLKLIYWPAALFMIAEYIAYGRYEPDFFAVKMCAVCCALAFIVIFFFTYSGVLGFTLLGVDIASFFVAAILCQYISYRLFMSDTSGDSADNLRGFVVLLLLASCFILWTQSPPSLGLFWG